MGALSSALPRSLIHFIILRAFFITSSEIKFFVMFETEQMFV